MQMNLSVFYTHNNPSVVIFDDLTIFDGIVHVISDRVCRDTHVEHLIHQRPDDHQQDQNDCRADWLRSDHIARKPWKTAGI